MPNRIARPPEDAKLGDYVPELSLYLLDARDEYPLYRDVKLIARVPCLLGRRTLRLSWIIHEGRFKRGGGAWALAQDNPALMKWCEEQCAAFLTLDYLQELYGFTKAELNAMIAAENKKYKK